MPDNNIIVLIPTYLLNFFHENGYLNKTVDVLLHNTLNPMTNFMTIYVAAMQKVLYITKQFQDCSNTNSLNGRIVGIFYKLIQCCVGLILGLQLADNNSFPTVCIIHYCRLFDFIIISKHISMYCLCIFLNISLIIC